MKFSGVKSGTSLQKLYVLYIPTNLGVMRMSDQDVLNLIRAGYKQRDDDTDQIIVERWFQYTCRNVALELYEQQQADPENRYRADLRMVQTKDIGDGRTEVS